MIESMSLTDGRTVLSVENVLTEDSDAIVLSIDGRSIKLNVKDQRRLIDFVYWGGPREDDDE
jgi:hypothetical protein